MKAIILSLAASHVSAEIVVFEPLRRLGDQPCTCPNGEAKPGNVCDANEVNCTSCTDKDKFEIQDKKCVEKAVTQTPSEYIQLCAAGKFPNQAIAHDMPDMIPVCHNEDHKNARCELDNRVIKKDDKEQWKSAMEECRTKCNDLNKGVDPKVSSDYMLDRPCNAFRVSESGTSCELYKIPGSAVPACGTGKGPTLYGAVNVDYKEKCTKDKVPNLSAASPEQKSPTYSTQKIYNDAKAAADTAIKNADAQIDKAKKAVTAGTKANQTPEQMAPLEKAVKDAEVVKTKAEETRKAIPDTFPQPLDECKAFCSNSAAVKPAAAAVKGLLNRPCNAVKVSSEGKCELYHLTKMPECKTRRARLLADTPESGLYLAVEKTKPKGLKAGNGSGNGSENGSSTLTALLSYAVVLAMLQ
jgi:hypothetical protein